MIDNHISDQALYKVHQHKIILFSNFIIAFLKFGIFSCIVVYFLFLRFPFFQIISIAAIPVLFFLFYWFFWVRSYFYITNEKIVVKVRNGIFSHYYMSIYYKNIRDLAYSKNNILHYFFDYGAFFARSSAGAGGDFEVPYIPQVEKVYKIINALYLLSEEKRKQIISLEQLQSTKISNTSQVIESEKQKLLSIK
jgi:hypothetical protein